MTWKERQWTPLEPKEKVSAVIGTILALVCGLLAGSILVAMVMQL